MNRNAERAILAVALALLVYGIFIVVTLDRIAVALESLVENQTHVIEQIEQGEEP